jgi:hypothetical protein
MFTKYTQDDNGERHGEKLLVELLQIYMLMMLRDSS